MAEEKQEEKVQKKSVPQNNIQKRLAYEDDGRDESMLNPGVKNESDLSRKERRLLEKEKLKDMGFRKKLEYFLMYYKWVIVSVVAAVFAVFAGWSWYENAKIESILNITPVNMGPVDTEVIEQEIKEFLGSDDKYEVVTVQSNLNTNQEGTQLDYYAQVAYIAQIQAKDFDIMLMPEAIYEFLEEEDVFMDMKELLGEELYNSFGDRAKDNCLVIENDELREKFGLWYEPIYVCVVFNSQNTENVVKWIGTLAE